MSSALAHAEDQRASPLKCEKGREKNNLFLSFLVLHRRMLKRPIFRQIKGGGGPSVIYAHCRTNGFGRSKKGNIREKGLVIMENKNRRGK